MGQAGIKHSLNKPFSDNNCGALLSEIGAIISLLPSKNLKILDVGCGSGWTSAFFAKKGHNVLGIDISKDFIKLANINKKRHNLPNLKFQEKNAEKMQFNSEFDCVTFIDSLHHCINIKKVLMNAYDSLKKEGICILSEPGLFHSKSPNSIKAMKEYGVLEKEIPPHLSKKIGKKIGFKNIKVYSRAKYLNFCLYTSNQNLPNFKIIRKLFRFHFIRKLASIFTILFYKRYDGIVFMQK
ncbi:MAG: methyltransferase domain-containing protein [Candidatus Lokiarchaeota archaeon]|nr:methyltransferase domain-containing protein [Candidatus Lokiarchaeota archaeon]